MAAAAIAVVLLSALVSALGVQTAVAQAVRAALVSDVDNPGKNFVQLEAQVSHPPGSGSSLICFDVGYAVPSGKRLVVEALSAEKIIGTGNTTLIELVAYTSAPCGLSQGETIAIAPMTFLGSNSGGTPFYGTAQRLTAYADAGRLLGIWVKHLAFVDSNTRYKVVIAGHLVSYP
jgi:hypothetical protein